MMHTQSLTQPDRPITKEVWEKLNLNYQQRAIELLAMLAIKHIVQQVAPTDHDVAET